MKCYLVGKIIEVNYTNSRALLLSDLNSKIPVVLEPIDIQAVVSGTGKIMVVLNTQKMSIEKKLISKKLLFIHLVMEACLSLVSSR